MVSGLPAPVHALVAVPSAVDVDASRFADTGSGRDTFAATLAAMTDSVAGAVGAADRSAAMLASGNGDVAAAAIARAKADVALEIASVAASRVSAAITSLLQTQT